MSTTKPITFTSRTDVVFNALMGFTVAVCLLPLYPLISNGLKTTESLIAFLVCSATVVLMLSFYTHTFYTIKDNKVYWRSSFLFGSFSIADIRKIEVGKTLWVGTRPATARKGLIIYYNKFDEIYFSPSDNEAFVAALTELNPTIEVVR